MSFNENQHSLNGEIDLRELFWTIWSYKYSMVLLIILSVPVSLFVSTIPKSKYKAETVFEKPLQSNRQGNRSLLDNIPGAGLMSFLGGSMQVGAGDTFFSEIRSESFLKTVIINNEKLDSQKMQEFCPLPSKNIARFSLGSLLVSLGISENRTPSESQKISLLVECVNDMLEVGFDNQQSGESSAYRLSVESEDPDFSANLANQIVEKYFDRHKKKKDEDFQNVKKYLSNVIAEAQLELTEANKLMRSFIIKHTLLMNINTNTSFTENADVDFLPPSPFAAKLGKDFYTLSQLEKSLSQLKQARLKLFSLKDLNQDEIQKAISSTEIQEALSRTFVVSIAKIDNLPEGTSFKNQEIKKIVGQEFRSLKQQIQVLEEKISKREEQTMKLMTIENRFQELAIDVSKKKIMFEGLKDQLKEKILTTGLAKVEQPVLLTKAVPPFKKSSPNSKLIVALGVALSILAGSAYILIRQNSLRSVHSLSQLQNLSKFVNCYKIKYKQLKLINEKSDVSVISQSFFSSTMGIGKLGCVIDLSDKKLNSSLASEFSISFAGLLSTDISKVVCLNTSPTKKLFSNGSQQNFASKLSDTEAQSNHNKSFFVFNDEDGIVQSGEINKIKNKYLDYDKIICSLGAEIGDITKFKFIEQCDFYILIGRSFHFDEYTFKKFSNAVWEKEKKCLGFFLID